MLCNIYIYNGTGVELTQTYRIGEEEAGVRKAHFVSRRHQDSQE